MASFPRLLRILVLRELQSVENPTDMAFQNLNLNNHEEWLRSKGFVWNDATRAWEKPRRVVRPVCPQTSTVIEPAVRDARIQPPQREAIYPGRVSLCITSYCCGTQRDADNICPKFFVDCCRYAGLIRDDCPDAIELVVKEKRVSTKKEEGCEIVITPL